MRTVTKYKVKDSHYLTTNTHTNLSRGSIITNSINTTKRDKKDRLEQIDDKGLNEIYERYLKLRNSTKINDFLKFMEMNSKDDLSHILLAQEKVLRLKDHNDNKHKYISEYIKNKIKKTEDAILMNNIHTYRKKRELDDLIEKKKKKDDRYGPNKWVASLRRPANFKGVRYAYVNMKTDKDPQWFLIKESVPEEREYIIQPNTTNKIIEIKKNEYLCKSLEDLGIAYDDNNTMHNFNLSV